MNKKQTSVKVEKTERETRMRKLIKKEAFALMAEKGLDGVSMREIAEKVKVTKPVLYYYFKDKEDLCRSIMAEQDDRFQSGLEQACLSGQDPQETVKEALFSQLDFFTENPVNSKFLLQMFAYTLHHKIRLPDEAAFPERLRGFLCQAERAGKIPSGAADDLVRLVCALSADMMLGAYIHHHIRPRKESASLDKNTLERLVQIMLLGLKAYYAAK